MLAQMRGFARSWVAYILLFVLAVAFAIWGVADVFSGPGGQNLASVGGRNITPPQLAREMELTLRAERNNGNNMTQQEAIDAGMHLRLLEGMIGRLALSEYAKKLGVNASDVQVAARIRDIPAVMNPVTGSFDEAAYDAFLQQLRYTRREFEEDVRSDITNNMVLEALMAGVRAPTSYGAMLLSYQAETRVVSIAEAPISSVGDIPAPTDAQLELFWQESQDALRVPEYRALTLVYAAPQDFVPRVSVPDQRLREEFEARRAAMTQPERRTYIRMAAQNEAQANDAVARLARGESPDTVAAALGLQVIRGENHVRDEVTDPRVAQAVFAAPAGSPRAVQGQLSPWVVIRVDAITGAVEPDFAAMRDELRQAIALDEAADMLNEAVSTFEDARASGSSVAEAAARSGLRVVPVPAVDSHGHDPNNAEIEALAGNEELIRTAFETAEGESSDFIPVGDADVIVSVDSVRPSYVRPLAEVRGQLTQAWISRERVRRLREKADQMTAAVRGGQTFEAAARANGFSVVIDSRELDRRMAAQIPARGLSGQVFAAEPGGLASDIRADGGAMLVAQVEQINRVDPATMPQEVEAMRAQMQQSLAQSFGQSLQDEIVRRANVRRNERLLNQTFRQTGAEDDAAAQ